MHEGTEGKSTPPTSAAATEHVGAAMVDAFAGPLPGPAAQALMSPRPRRGWTPGVLPSGCRQAAALALVYRRRSTPCLLLTLRRDDLRSHPGQVALPGGEIDDGEDPVSAALREAWEEVGLDPTAPVVVGKLTPLHIPASGFHVHPIAATVAPDPELVANETEVRRIMEVPLIELTEATPTVETRELRGRPAEVPFFPVAGEKIWGATAMILAEFLALLGTPPDPWGGRYAARGS